MENKVDTEVGAAQGKEDTGEALERMETKMDTEVGAAQGKEDTGKALE